MSQSNKYHVLLGATLSTIDSSVIPMFATAENPTVGLKAMLHSVPSEHRAALTSSYMALQNATFRDLASFIRELAKLSNVEIDELLQLRSVESQSTLAELATIISARRAPEMEEACRVAESDKELMEEVVEDALVAEPTETSPKQDC